LEGFLPGPHISLSFARWIGGGIVAVIGGLWAAFKFFTTKEKPKAQAGPTVSASNGGVAAGHDIRNTQVNARGGSKREGPIR